MVMHMVFLIINGYVLIGAVMSPGLCRHSSGIHSKAIKHILIDLQGETRILLSPGVIRGRMRNGVTVLNIMAS